MVRRNRPVGTDAEVVEQFRVVMRERLESDLTLCPHLMGRILKLAEWGLEHGASVERTKLARRRGVARRVAELQARFGADGARVRRLFRAVSHDARYRTAGALKKRLQRWAAEGQFLS